MVLEKDITISELKQKVYDDFGIIVENLLLILDKQSKRLEDNNKYLF